MASKYDFNDRPEMEPVFRIILEHLQHARRYPKQIQDIASRLRISEDAALAVAISDHICEEFNLAERT